MSETSTVHSLLITDAKGNRKLLLEGLKYTIGRDVNNDIQLHSRFVSRQHAVMLRVPGTDPGKYLYRIIDGDLAGKPSVNGVIINSHHRVTSYELCHGDIITLAPNVQLTYLTDPETHAHSLNNLPVVAKNEAAKLSDDDTGDLK